MSATTGFSTNSFRKLYETQEGQKIWEFLNEPMAIERMKTASDLGKPAILGVEKNLLENSFIQEKTLIDEKDTKQFHRLKQMLGAMVRQVMEANGYKLTCNNVKTTNSVVFVSASRYEQNKN